MSHSLTASVTGHLEKNCGDASGVLASDFVTCIVSVTALIFFVAKCKFP